MDQFEDTWKVMKEHRLELVDNTSSEYKCILCGNILINACGAHCGCRFCLHCIKEYLKDGKRKCPGQSQLCVVEEIDFDTDIQINRIINKIVARLSVKCPNLGCESQLQLSTIGDHLKACDNRPETCPYFTLGCREEKLWKDQAKDHLSMEIHHHSKLLMSWIRQSQNEMRSMRCEIDKLKEANDALKEKLKSDEEKSNKIIQHLEKRGRENSSEIDLLNEEMCALKNSHRSTKYKLKASKEKQKEQISRFETKLEIQNQEVDKLKSENRDQSQEIATLKEQSQLLESQLDEIRQQQERSNAKFIEISPMISAESMETKKSFESRQITNKMHNGDFTWEIDNLSIISEKSRNGQDDWIYSDPFFTHYNGYKIRLATFATENNFEIRFQIMRGPFDDTLRWPFNRDVELTVINQKTGLAYKSDSRKCSLYPTFTSLQKPKSDQNGWPFSFYFGLTREEILRRPEVCHKDKIAIKFSSKPTFNRK